jgi:hypothetical protein
MLKRKVEQMQKWAWIYKHGIEYITVPDWVEKRGYYCFFLQKRRL